MSNIILRPDWHLPEKLVTPESVFNNRRSFLKQMGITGAGLLSIPLAGCSKENKTEAVGAPTPGTPTAGSGKKHYPAPRNPEFNPKGALTVEKEAGSYNNFYEFSLSKQVTRYTGNFVTSPWSIQIGGLVEKPLQLDLQEFLDTVALEGEGIARDTPVTLTLVMPRLGRLLNLLLDELQLTYQLRDGVIRVTTVSAAGDERWTRGSAW